MIFYAENIPKGATGAVRTLRRLLDSRSFHQAILNLVEPPAPVLVGEVVVRKPLLLGLLNLPEQGGLVRRVMPDQHPPAGFVAHVSRVKLIKNSPKISMLSIVG